jgi:hypothetical protein
MKPRLIYSVTKQDVRDAITLCSAMACTSYHLLWCDGYPPEKFGKATCGHTDPWWCAAAALGISADAVNLMIRASNAVRYDAWAAAPEDRAEAGLVVLAPHRDTELFNEELEAECLLREGWLPNDYRLTRGHHPDRGEYLALHWEYSEPEAFYVRGHVDSTAFRSAMEAYFGARNPCGASFVIRHAHAWWACEGNDGYGNANRVLRECSGDARGAFAVTVMDAPAMKSEAA